MTKKEVILAVSTAFMLIYAAGISTAINVYFYEGKTNGDYKLDGGYSQLKKDLESKGYKVETMKAELTKQNLDGLQADILVLSSIGSELSVNEMTAVFQFVMKDGKGVFICGTSPSVNKLIIPLGMTIPDDLLEDDRNSVTDLSTGQIAKEKTIFYIDFSKTYDDPTISAITKGISKDGKINFFGSNGITIYGNAKGILFGSDSLNAPKAPNTFPKGSNPPLLATAKVGKGSIVVLTDPDVLANKYLDQAKYRSENLKLGVNIIDWLSTPSADTLTTNEMDNVMKFLRSENINLNRTITSLQEEKLQTAQDLSKVTAEKNALERELSDAKKDQVPGTPLSYTTAAMLFAGACFLITAFVVLKRGGKKGKGKRGSLEKVAEKSELGYEFDDQPEENKTPSEIKEEDIEERLKELQKNSASK